MNGETIALISQYELLRAEVEPLLFVARSTALQKAAALSVQEFRTKIEVHRVAAITAQNEITANNMLGLSAILASLICELETYVLLKEEQPSAAWDKLIDAQDGLNAAMRATVSFANLPNKAKQLRELEASLFPPQTFLSAGLIVKRQECSICQDDYDKCEHIAGKAYMGVFCAVRLSEVTADHVSFVEEPANRRCRVIRFSVPGGHRNKMTWEITAEDA